VRNTTERYQTLQIGGCEEGEDAVYADEFY